MAGKRLSHKQKKEIRKERRRMRKELWYKGIKKRSEYEEIMVMLNLVIRDEPWWLLFWRGLKRWLASLTIGTLLRWLGTFLLGLFFYSVLANRAGFFRVNLSNALINDGFQLSYTRDFQDPKVLLDTGKMQEVNAISIQDIQEDIAQLDGAQDITNLTAVSFYVRNNGTQPQDFKWTLLHNRSTRNVDKACWLVFFVEDKAWIYSMANTENPDQPEKLEGMLMTPFRNNLADPFQYGGVEDDATLTAIPFEGDRIIHEGSQLAFAPGEVKRFTAIIWVEGDDPDCTPDILGGHAGFGVSMKEIGEANAWY